MLDSLEVRFFGLSAVRLRDVSEEGEESGDSDSQPIVKVKKLAKHKVKPTSKLDSKTVGDGKRRDADRKTRQKARSRRRVFHRR